MLYLVATPIGNLGDITLRGLEVLRAVDVIASEDTRKTGLLLKHFDIRKPQIAFHEHNEDRAGERIMGLLAEGKSVAVVTEAGTPGISDPGLLARAARDRCGRGSDDDPRPGGGDHGRRARRVCRCTASPTAASRRTNPARGGASSKWTAIRRTRWSFTKALTAWKPSCADALAVVR